MTLLLPSENVLPDDYPMYADYWYIVDGQPVRSDWHDVTVGYYKARTGANEVRRCDAAERKLPLLRW